MARSLLPLPSLLCLSLALLMLSQELLMVIREGLSDMPLTDPGVQKAVASVVEQYNQERGDLDNYLKMWDVLKAKMLVVNGKIDQYRLKLELVETTCRKTTDMMRYKKIQQCQQLPGIVTKTILYSIFHLKK